MATEAPVASLQSKGSAAAPSAATSSSTGAGTLRGDVRQCGYAAGQRILSPRRRGLGDSAMAAETAAPDQGSATVAEDRTALGAEIERREAGLPADPESGWGVVLGDVHGVDVRQNHPSNAAVLRQNVPGIHAPDAPGQRYEISLRSEFGLLYQCVELVNRYYALRLGHTNMKGTGHAKSYLGHGDRGLETHLNGGPERPQPGDLMVKTDGTWGHVGIVRSASESSFEVANQNQAPFTTHSVQRTATGYTFGSWAGFRRKPGSNASGLDAAPTTAPGVLAKGSRGPRVESVQRRLVSQGFLTEADVSTGPGIFGPRTDRAVRAFQAAHGLPVTGSVDEATLSALEGTAAPSTPGAPAMSCVRPPGTGEVNQPAAARQPADDSDSPGSEKNLSGLQMLGGRVTETHKGAGDRVTHSPINRTGDFNVAGKGGGWEWEVARKPGGGYHFRRSSQRTKDVEAVQKRGGNSSSTKNAGVPVDWSVGFQHELGKTELLSPMVKDQAQLTDKVSAGWQVGGAEASAGLTGELSEHGIAVELGGSAKATLVGGELVYRYPAWEFTLAGEHLEAELSVALSAEVAAAAEGKAEFRAKNGPDGIHVGPAAGGQVFAGGRAGIKAAVRGAWHTPEGVQDVIGAFAGAEAWAGVAGAAQLAAQLAPSVKIEGYLAGAIGIGGGLKVGVEVQTVRAARLAYVLASRGVKAAWDGLEDFAGDVAEWVKSGAADVYTKGSAVVESVSNHLLGDSEALELVQRGLHRHMTVGDRAKLLDRFLAGTCMNEEEDAILTVLRHAKQKGDMWELLGRTEGGVRAIDSNLDFGQQDQFDALIGR